MSTNYRAAFFPSRCGAPAYATTVDGERIEVARCELALPHDGPHTRHEPDGSIFEWPNWTTKARPTLRSVPTFIDESGALPMWEVVCDHDECGGVVRCVGDEEDARALAALHRDNHVYEAKMSGGAA